MQQHQLNSLFTVCEVDITYRPKIKATDRPRVSDSFSAFDILVTTWDANKIELVEEFKILLLNRRDYCIGLVNISVGGISACVVDPKIIYATALKACASGIVMAHNHPSGDVTPSEPDIALTRKLKYGGQLLDISVKDHLIITPRRYYSFVDEGMMP